jgi:hypothetical protein
MRKSVGSSYHVVYRKTGDEVNMSGMRQQDICTKIEFWKPSIVLKKINNLVEGYILLRGPLQGQS